MLFRGEHSRTIWVKKSDQRVVQIIDQRYLPHRPYIEDLFNVYNVVNAIKNMHVRGAGLIGATAGYGMYLAVLEAPPNNFFDAYLTSSGNQLKATRPTAVNLAWAVDRQLRAIASVDTLDEKIAIAFKTANEIADEDAENCRRIGEHGVKIIEEISRRKNGKTVNILTHCNAGWLAFVDYGSATSPIYAAFEKDIDIHVWVDETRPINQGARLTAWELNEQCVPHTVIVDNVGGHLMQHGLVDMVIVGSDRTTYTGDVANKVGTYLKALAAYDNNVPFYVALPSSTFDWTIKDGVNDIPIEQRGAEEVKYITGLCHASKVPEGELLTVLLTPKDSPADNYAFDVTPSRLVTGLITEKGICKANEDDILRMYPEHRGQTESKR
ncbi:MAG: S-methyl-5-thioribose-1-phosphate isomerase [Candidatus Woesearchaeota archaeon]